jgi:hypothetical protein
VQYKCCDDKNLGPTCYDPETATCIVTIFPRSGNKPA